MTVVLLILLAIAICHLVCIHSKKIRERIALKISDIASMITTSIVQLLSSNSKILVLGGITTQVTRDEIDELVDELIKVVSVRDFRTVVDKIIEFIQSSQEQNDDDERIERLVHIVGCACQYVFSIISLILCGMKISVHTKLIFEDDPDKKGSGSITKKDMLECVIITYISKLYSLQDMLAVLTHMRERI